MTLAQPLASHCTGCTAAALLPRYSPEQVRIWTLSSCPTVNADTKHTETVIHGFILSFMSLPYNSPGAGCPARITLLFNHIGRAALPVALHCSWNWVIVGQAVGFLAATTHGVSAVRAQTTLPLSGDTLCLCLSAFPQCSLLPWLEFWPHHDPSDEEHCRSFQVARAIFLLQCPQQSG